MRVVSFSSYETVPNDLILDGHQIVPGQISGGCYAAYLSTVMSQYQGKVCLLIDRHIRKFSLPDHTGQGTELSYEQFREICSNQTAIFSPALCSNYIYLPDPPTIILFDDANSLRRKILAAKTSSVPMILVHDSVLQKIKTP